MDERAAAELTKAWQEQARCEGLTAAVITEPQQVRKDPGNRRLLQPAVALHRIKSGKAPPGLDPASLH